MLNIGKNPDFYTLERIRIFNIGMDQDFKTFAGMKKEMEKKMSDPQPLRIFFMCVQTAPVSVRAILYPKIII